MAKINNSLQFRAKTNNSMHFRTVFQIIQSMKTNLQEGDQPIAPHLCYLRSKSICKQTQQISQETKGMAHKFESQRSN